MAQSNVGRQRVVDCWSSNRTRVERTQYGRAKKLASFISQLDHVSTVSSPHLIAWSACYLQYLTTGFQCYLVCS